MKFWRVIIDKDGNFIKEWESQAEAKRWIGKGDIQGCIDGRQKTAGGFIWKRHLD